MTKHHHDDQPSVQAHKPSRQAKLQTLLFASAALGTTLLIGAAADPKIPPFVGE